MTNEPDEAMLWARERRAKDLAAQGFVKLTRKARDGDFDDHYDMRAIADGYRAGQAAMQAKLDALAAALKPFADCCEYINENEDDEEWAKFRLLISHYRAARAALDAAK